jgi:hypothetical protein
MSKENEFQLWLEWEQGEPIDQPANRTAENFGNVVVTLGDGRRYALNVWTFDFLPLARFPWPHEARTDVAPASYVVAPDLFVDSLTRSTLETVVAEMLDAGGLNERWLCRTDDE